MTALKVAAQSVYRMWSSRVVLGIREQAEGTAICVILSSLTFHISSFVSLSLLHISLLPPRTYESHVDVVLDSSSVQPSDCPVLTVRN